MGFRADWLWEEVGRLPQRSNGEFYLTDLAARALADGGGVVGVKTDEATEALGINTQLELARANRLAWDRELDRLMAGGVVVLDPATTYVGPDVEVGPGTVIYPHTHLTSRARPTRIGRDCVIGPNTSVVDSDVGDRSHVWYSVVEGSSLAEDVEMGPFAHLRPGCVVGRGVELGNFSEAKSSRIGPGSKIHHFSYVGDATLGNDVNVGAGSITCNYDGAAKHRTVIGDGAFIGSDTMLIAPVTIGPGARTGAGAVVTRDVAAGTTVVGVPARPHRADPPAADGPLAKDGG
jgi:bifunctional UDP-N-acetylglucosamine pyrophosphorylase/glucosamine-1-phosphate N-acetyltransferase